jgi:hypothetical protein
VAPLGCRGGLCHQGRAAGDSGGDISKVLMDLGFSPILGIPRDPRTAGDILEAVDVILHRMWEAYASTHVP